nr:unnamed protein product [Callosobruchus chinensis]
MENFAELKLNDRLTETANIAREAYKIYICQHRRSEEAGEYLQFTLVIFIVLQKWERKQTLNLDKKICKSFILTKAAPGKSVYLLVNQLLTNLMCLVVT